MVAAAVIKVDKFSQSLAKVLGVRTGDSAHESARWEFLPHSLEYAALRAPTQVLTRSCRVYDPAAHSQGRLGRRRASWLWVLLVHPPLPLPFGKPKQGRVLCRRLWGVWMQLMLCQAALESSVPAD